MESSDSLTTPPVSVQPADPPLTPSSTMVPAAQSNEHIPSTSGMISQLSTTELSAMPTITTTTMAAASSTVTTTADLQVFDPLTNTHTTVPATEGKEGETEEQQD